MRLLEPPSAPPVADRSSDDGALGTVLYVSGVAALGGLLFGYDSAVINGAVGALGAHFRANPTALGLAVSSALIGAAYDFLSATDSTQPNPDGRLGDAGTIHAFICTPPMIPEKLGQPSMNERSDHARVRFPPTHQ